jgi:hypothetical protein
MILECGSEETPAVVVVWSLIERESLDIDEEFGELDGEACAQDFRADGCLELANCLSSLASRNLETLPREATLAEVDQDVGDGLQIISAGLLKLVMRVHRGVAVGSSEGRFCVEGDMFACTTPEVREAKVNDINVA